MAEGTPTTLASAGNGAPTPRVGAAQAFLKPVLRGARFEGHAIPLEFLKDLAVIEEMVIEVAKWRFLQAHQDRKRSPRGFTDGVALKLTGIEEGSAVPVISLVMASTTLFPPANQVYFEEARAAIVAAIGAAEQNGTILDHLPETSLSYFDRMGRSLRDGEAIEFPTGEGTAPARLTKETRRRLVLASSRVTALTEETTIRGSVPEADQDEMTFEIQLVDGRKVSAPMTEPHAEAVLEAFNGYKRGVRVLLQGIGRINRSNRLEKLESIEHVSVLDPLDIAARLDELRLLKAGWLSGDGLALDHAGLTWLSSAFEEHVPENAQLPYLYPTVEGGVRAEWPLRGHEVSINIDLSGKVGAWHALKMATDEEETKDLDLSNPDDWKWIVSRIQTIAGGGA